MLKNLSNKKENDRLNFMINMIYSLNFIILAGMPPTTALSGISFVTTAFAPIVTLLPILT